MIKLLTYCLFLFPFSGWSQLHLVVNLASGQHPIELNQPIQQGGFSFQLEQARFYLSKFEFYQQNQLVSVDSSEAYLVDFELDSTRELIFPAVRPDQVDEIRFLFGIDSSTNTSGAMKGALDPMYGMYWSWQSGYINCKLEGTFLTPKREEFQLHLGGYRYPFDAVKQIFLKTDKKEAVSFQIDLNALMENVLKSGSEMQVMSPSGRAVEYAELVAKSIYLTP